MRNLETPPPHVPQSRIWSGDAGLEVVEYALIAALLLGVLLVILPQFSSEFIAALAAINNALADAMGG